MRNKILKKNFGKNGKKKYVWRCENRLDYGTRFCKQAPTLDETLLQEAIVRAMSLYNQEEYDNFQESMRLSINEALGMNENSTEKNFLESRIKQLEQEYVAEIERSVMQGPDLSETEAKFKEISKEIAEFTSRLNAIKTQSKYKEDAEERMRIVRETMESFKTCAITYNDDAVRNLIECIKVYADGCLDVIFGGGYTIKENVKLL